MSDAFSEREKGFERKYQLDQEREFRVQSRRDKLFGYWIASLLGHTGDDADKYARAVVASNFAKPGDEDLLDKVRADLKSSRIEIAEDELARKLHGCAAEAAEQIMADLPTGG
ncbi:MAG: DUF1476 domain-containing protein [Rhodospirillaceae bacterium]